MCRMNAASSGTINPNPAGQRDPAIRHGIDGKALRTSKAGQKPDREIYFIQNHNRFSLLKNR